MRTCFCGGFDAAAPTASPVRRIDAIVSFMVVFEGLLNCQEDLWKI